MKQNTLSLLFSKQSWFAVGITLALIGLLACTDSSKTPSESEDNTMTTAPTLSPYGTWASPISAELAASSSNGLLGLQVSGEDLYWLEMRPTEGGRYVLMRHAEGETGEVEVLPAEYNVRTRVHEYGGRAFLVHEDTVYFSNFADQALYRMAVARDQSGEVEPVAATEGLRYAECVMDAQRNRLLCVREDHRGEGEAVNGLVALDLSSQPASETLLWQESDFVGYPSMSPDGQKLAWISWDHPNMPWDNVSLWLADVSAEGTLGNVVKINEGKDESVLQPTWSPNGTLYFLTDRSGWWNMHRLVGETIQPVHTIDRELGGPLWSLGSVWFALRSDKEALVEYSNKDENGLGLLDLDSGVLKPLDVSFSGYANLAVQGDQAWFIAGRDSGPGQLVTANLVTGETSVVVQSGEDVVASDYLSKAQAITFPTAGGGEAYAYYYPPVNADFAAPEGELPPL